MRSNVLELSISDDVSEKLWAHIVQEQEVWEVLWGAPVFKSQQAQDDPQPDGTLRRRPERLLMIGRTRSGRLLTVVLELPDNAGVSEVVTGFDSKGNELGWYRQGGGR